MRKALAILEKFPLFLVTVPLFIIIHLEAAYRNLIKYEFVYGEIIQLLSAPFILFAFCCLLLKSWPKRMVYCFLLMLVFFFFADVKDFFYKISHSLLISRYSFLLPSALVICIGGYLLIKKSNSRFSKLILYINLVFICFICADMLVLIFSGKKNAKSLYLDEHSIADTYQPCKECPKPDIYYVVFDYYTSTKRLKMEFGYDNSSIDSFLSEKGFYIAGNSKSNYNFTAHSIGSIFNMNYLKKITPYKKIYLKNYLPVIGTIYDNELVSILEKEGYKISNLSVFDFKNTPSAIPHYNLWAYDVLYRRHNIFKKIDSEIGWLIKRKLPKVLSPRSKTNPFVSAKEIHDSLALHALGNTIPGQTDRQQFTYLHIETAHAPFVFDSTGLLHPRRKWPVSPEQDKADYVSQLVYSNRFLKQTITTIFEKSKRPFIIVLQGDHGYRFFDHNMRDKEFDNLNAFYFPDKNYSMLNDSMTTVNTFRIVLNKYFNQDFVRLKDSSIYVDY